MRKRKFLTYSSEKDLCKANGWGKMAGNYANFGGGLYYQNNFSLTLGALTSKASAVQKSKYTARVSKNFMYVGKN